MANTLTVLRVNDSADLTLLEQERKALETALGGLGWLLRLDNMEAATAKHWRANNLQGVRTVLDADPAPDVVLVDGSLGPEQQLDGIQFLRDLRTRGYRGQAFLWTARDVDGLMWERVNDPLFQAQYGGGICCSRSDGATLVRAILQRYTSNNDSFLITKEKAAAAGAPSLSHSALCALHLAQLAQWNDNCWPAGDQEKFVWHMGLKDEDKVNDLGFLPQAAQCFPDQHRPRHKISAAAWCVYREPTLAHLRTLADKIRAFPGLANEAQARRDGDTGG